MSKSVCAVLAISLLLATPQLFAQSSYYFNKSRSYTEKDRDECLKSSPEKSSYLCNTYPITPESQRPLPRSGLAPDPTTPRFNQCLDTYREVYNYVLSNCPEELNKDLSGRTNWLGLWTDESKASKEHAWARIREIKLENIQAQHARNAALRDSRVGQTPLQNAMDRLDDATNRPCVYYDEHHISQSCD